MKKIFVAQPFLPPLKEYIEYLNEIWDSKQITNDGIFLKEFENQLSQFTNIKNVICISNGTLALQIAIKALNLRGEIITTPFSFVATSSSIVWEQCKPIYVDINPDTLNINSEKIEEKITEKTSAIIPVHVFGNPCDVKKIKIISERYKIKVLYDSAHAFGVNYNEKSIFSYGDLSVASFHATKILNTAEGGAIFTNDNNLAKIVRSIRNFGYKDGKITNIGINGKLNEICAALGLLNLKYFNYILMKRKKIFLIYMKYLRLNKKIILPNALRNGNYSYFPIIFQSRKYKQRIVATLNKENIYPKEYFYPSLDTLNLYSVTHNCPIAKDISERILCLPIFPELKIQDATKITNLINRDEI